MLKGDRHRVNPYRGPEMGRPRRRRRAAERLPDVRQYLANPLRAAGPGPVRGGRPVRARDRGRTPMAQGAVTCLPAVPGGVLGGARRWPLRRRYDQVAIRPRYQSLLGPAADAG